MVSIRISKVNRILPKKKVRPIGILHAVKPTSMEVCCIVEFNKSLQQCKGMKEMYRTFITHTHTRTRTHTEREKAIYARNENRWIAYNKLNANVLFIRISQAVASLLRRLGLPYQGNESYGKIRINGISLRRWLQPKLDSPFSGKPGEWSTSLSRLGKGISFQQRDIRTGDFSLE